MTNSYRSVAWAGVAAIALGSAGAAQDRPKVPEPLTKSRPDDPRKKLTVMQRKLAHAQKVLEGLAKEDYDKIRGGSDGLMECVKESSWRINDTDKYLLFSNEFLRTVENLRKAAKDKKIDAAALAYVDMTLTCVKCHRYLREAGIALVPAAVPPATTTASTVARRP